MKKRILSVAVLLLAMVFGSGTAAVAHYVYDIAYVWENGAGQCLKERTELSHGNGGGYTRTDIYPLGILNSPFGSVHCERNVDVATGYLRTKHQLDVYGLYGWSYCTQTAFKYNGSSAQYLKLEKYWGSTPPCGGRAYYYAWGLGQWYFNGSWVGGWLGSKDVHLLPP